jgi:predicted transcriptional regulator YheO
MTSSARPGVSPAARPHTVPPHLASYVAVAEALNGHFGSSCEVVLHDLSRPEDSLVYVAGTITGRPLGAPVTNVVLEALRRSGDAADNLIGYRTRTADGRMMRSSTIFIRNGMGSIVGCICINSDLTAAQLLNGTLQELLTFREPETAADQDNEHFATDVTDLVDQLVEKVINTATTPVALMDRAAKMNVVAKLESRGVFLVKGTVEQVARILGVTRYTLYNYIDEVRSRSGGPGIDRDTGSETPDMSRSK